MASLGAPMPMLAAIIAVVMEVPAAILIVLGFSPVRWRCCLFFYTLGTAVIGHHYWDMTGDAVGPNMTISEECQYRWRIPAAGNYRAGGNFSRSALG